MNYAPFQNIEGRVYELLSRISKERGFNTEIGQAVVPVRDEKDAKALERFEFNRGTIAVMWHKPDRLRGVKRGIGDGANQYSRLIDLYAPIKIPTETDFDDYRSLAYPYISDMKKAMLMPGLWGDRKIPVTRVVAESEHVWSPPSGSSTMIAQVELSIIYTEAYA